MEKVTVMESAELEKKCTEGWEELPVQWECITGTSWQELPALEKALTPRRGHETNAHEMRSVQKGKATWKNRKQVAHFQRAVYMFICLGKIYPQIQKTSFFFFFFLSLTRCQSLSWVHSRILSHLILSTTNQNCKGLVLKQSRVVSR